MLFRAKRTTQNVTVEKEREKTNRQSNCFFKHTLINTFSLIDIKKETKISLEGKKNIEEKNMVAVIFFYWWSVFKG